MSAAIYVFDIDEFKLLDELNEYFPGIRNIMQTPVIALYKKGVLKNIYQGEEIC